MTDTGGTTSHPAVLSREFGIPAVIGTSDRDAHDPHRRSDPRRRFDRRGRDPRRPPSGAEPAASPIGSLMPATVASGTLARSVLADQVKERLLEEILGGRYARTRGSSRRRSPASSGTSQAPVREALRGLEALGVVEITPFRGARVRRPTRRELLEAYVVRSALEALGARLAVPRLSDDDSPSSPATSRRCRRPPGPATATRSPRRTPGSTAGSSRSPTTGRSARCGARSSRSRAPTSRSSSPAPTRSGRPTCTRRSSPRCWRATPTRSSLRSTDTSTRSREHGPAPAGPSGG